ncbi:uncharacterized protein LOC107266087 [Cephus cinctus]|uniref:Uncharacterized protein LOC107266087 n=1 Tax=Cephus cinctus TaxID=211228 RepID=A0AAJ7BR32_CEPCN|nr:uncharacterized protein LOC107266087 [Cephus cinctus]
MIEKNEQAENNSFDSSDATNVKLIAEKQKLLEDTSAQVQEGIRNCFKQLENVLKSREKQLLRQVEAIHTQQLSLVQSNLQLVPSIPSLIINLYDKEEIENRILNFAKLELSDKNSTVVKDVEPYKVEEYQDADKDHISFNKSIKFEEKDQNEKSFNQEVEAGTTFNISSSNKNTIIYNNSVLSSSCNSSLNSSLENEAGTQLETTTLLNSNYKPNNELLLSKDYDNSFSNSSASPVELSKAVPLNCKKRLEDKDYISLDESQAEHSVTLIKNSDSVMYNVMVDIADKKIDEGSENSDKPISTYIETDLDRSVDINEHEDTAVDERLAKEVLKSEKGKRDSEEHPKQVQQWLQQILVETETEPTINEIGQFSEISKARLYSQFPVET